MRVYKDRRFLRVVYVVEFDHVIKYAGPSFLEASNAIKGSQHIVVWMDSQWMGNVNADGEWIFTTRHNPVTEVEV